MRVTVVGPTHPYKGGISQHTTSLARHLAAAAHEVDLLSWSSQYPKRLYPGELELGDPDSEPSFPGTRRALAWYDPTSWWRAAAPNAMQADVLVLTVVNGLQVPAYLTLSSRARRAGTRVVALCHNVIPHEIDPVQRRLMRSLLRRVDSVLVHSDTERRDAESLGVKRIEQSRLPFFFPDVPTGTPVLAPVSQRLLFFGFVRPYKGVDVLVEAVARAECEVGLTIAGEFWMSSDVLRDRVARLDLGDRVDIREGYLAPADVLDLIATHDALVVPYLSGTGSQHPEVAHLVGRPVIATRVGDLADQVDDGIDGLLVDPGDPAALAAAIDALYADDLLKTLAAGVRPPDEAGQWSVYLDALLAP